jgi:uncharacterized protein YqeY
MLKEQIKKDLDASLKTGDHLKRSVLGMLSSAIQNRTLSKRAQLSKTLTDSNELETKSQLTEDEIIEVVSGEIKKRKESVEQFKAGGRNELAEKEAKEIGILIIYMPTQLSEADVTTEIDLVIKSTGAKGMKDMGRVIGIVMAKVKGKADGNFVSRIVKEKLQ